MDLKIKPEQVEKAGNAKWEENLRFRQWLKTQPPEIIAEAVDRIGRKVAASVDCTQCANCCKGLSVVPKPSDIKRLSQGLGLDFYEFKTKYLKKDFEGDLAFRQRPCPFLKSDKCSVYEHRPDTCRSYPHLEKNHMVGRGWHIVENTRVCPIVFLTYEQLKTHFGYRPEPTLPIPL